MADTLRVLYVDDEPDFLELCKIYLERTGEFSVDTVLSGKEALTQLGKQQYDAIISDYQMTEMDGISLLKQVRAIYVDVSFILFTGRGREEVVIEAINNGADFYLQKGGDPRAQFLELMHKVRQSVSKRRADLNLNRAYEEIAASEEELKAQFDAIKEHNAMIQASEEKFRETTDNIPGVVFQFVAKADGSLMLPYISDRVRDILGVEHTRGDMFETLTSRIHPDDKAAFFASVDESVRSRSPWRAEARFIKPSGETIWLQGISSPVEHGNELVFYGVLIDISDRKNGEIALRESEGRYRSLVDISPDAVLIHQDGNIVYMNPAGLALVGAVSPDEVINKKVFDFVHPDFRDIVRMNIDNDLKGEISPQVELRMCRTDGTTVDVEGRGIKTWFEGRPAVQVAIRDITGRKKNEEALRESEEKFRVIFGVQQVGILMIDAISYEIVDLNPIAAAMIGLGREEIIGKVCHRFICPNESGKCPVGDLGQTIDNSERVLLSKDRGRIPVLKTVTRACLGEHPYLIESFIDISQRIKAEEELHKSESHLCSIIRVAPIGIGVISNRIIQTVNDQICRITGYTAEELIGKSSRIFYPTQEDYDDVGREKYAQIEKIGSGSVETRWQKKDGTIINILLSSAPVDPSDLSIGVTFTALDITERKRGDDYRHLSTDILGILNEPAELQDVVRRVLIAIKMVTNADAVGIRLKADDDFPYFVQNGFSRDFLMKENTLVERDPAGEICRDSEGNVSLECTCGLVISGKTGPENPLFTPGGSSWTNNSFPILELPETDDPRHHPRNTCIHTGYASVALIPIRKSPHQIIGILQINAFRKDCFTPAIIQSLEQIAGHIGQALMRKQAEVALAESEDRFRTIINSMQFGIVIIDAQTHTILEANPKALEMIGSTTESVVGSVCHQFICPAESGNCPVTDLGQTIDSSERILLTPEGESISILKSVIRTRLGGREVMIESFIDISDRKRAEVALRESEERYRSNIEQSLDGILISDEHGNVAIWNKSMESITGIHQGDAIGRPIWEIMYRLTPEEQKSPELLNGIQKSLNNIFELKMDLPGETREQLIQCADGTRKEVQESSFTIKVSNTLKFGASIRDITQRRRAEEAVRLANRKLNLLSGITRHDINNQLTVLRGYLEIKNESESGPSQKEYFQKANAAAERISSMIRFTKEYEEIGVHAPTWQECSRLLDTAARDIPLGRVVVKNDLPCGSEVFADPLIVRVCYNLMDNAVRYGGKITTIRFSVEESGDKRIIFCEDDGNGVPDVEKEKIFERGFGKNTGMGLFLAREILSITGIKIRETGEHGKGARFEITVPKGMWRIKGCGE